MRLSPTAEEKPTLKNLAASSYVLPLSSSHTTCVYIRHSYSALPTSRPFGLSTATAPSTRPIPYSGGEDARGMEQVPPDSQDSGQNGGRRSGKRPQKMKFMFIDSTDHGRNAKPDKAVRSFVMHQARRSKTWSTRQRGATSPNSVETDPPSTGAPEPAGSSAVQSKAQRAACKRRRWRNASSTPSPLYAQSDASSASSCKHSGHSTPASSVGSVYDPRYSNGELYLQAHRALARQDGFALGVIDPFDCLAVRMDSKTSSMLDHCKPPRDWCASHIY
jgi:hypothetical protein